MQSNSSRRQFIAVAAAAVLPAKLRSAFSRVGGASTALGPAALSTDADASLPGINTAVYTYDCHARLLGVTQPCDAVATSFTYADA